MVCLLTSLSGSRQRLVPQQPQGAQKRRNTKSKKAASPTQQGREYWFVTPFPKLAGREEMRVKFVNRNEYQIVRHREGWLEAKDKGKLKSRWVRYAENTLMLYKDADDEEPYATFEDINDFEFAIKTDKHDVTTIKMKKNKVKLELRCETSLVLALDVETSS